MEIIRNFSPTPLLPDTHAFPEEASNFTVALRSRSQPQ